MIILIHINFSEDHSEKILPLGILSVGSALSKNGYEVKLININEKEIDKTVAEVVKLNPSYVGVSVMTGAQTKHSAEFSRKLKEKKNIPVLWGGIHPSLLSEQCLNEDYIDYVLIGEGEETILEFTDNFLKKELFYNVKGLGFKDGERIILNERRPLIADLNKWRLDFGLIDLEKFIFPLGKYKRVIAYKSSRGCPFQCAFCYNFEFNKSRWRVWSEDAVLEDINFLKTKYKIDAVKFYDDNFFVDKKRAFFLLQKMDLPSHLEIRIDAIDETVARELKGLNIFDMLIGIESGSDRILQMIDKKFTVEKLIQGVKNIAKHDLHATYSFIVGLPTETKEEFNDTINLMYRIYKIHPKAGFTLGAYLPYPGSKMFDFSLKNGFKIPASTEEWGEIDRFRKDFKSPWVNVRKVWIVRECFKILSWDFKPLKKWFEMRIKFGIYFLPLDIYIVEYLAAMALEERNFFGKFLRRVYNFLR